MSGTPNFQDWYVATAPVRDSSNRIANTMFVASAVAIATMSLSQLATVAADTILSNPTAAQSGIVATTLSLFIDNAIGAAQGNILYRNAASWVALPIGAVGSTLKSNGTSPVWV